MKIFLLALVAGLASSDVAEAHPTRETGEASAAHSPGKPEHPLQLELRPRGMLKAGEQTDVELVLSSSFPLESVNVNVRPLNNALVAQDRFERRNGNLAAERALMLPLRITPTGDEAPTLSIHVEATLADGRVLTRELTMPVRTAAKDGAQRGKKKGELPARRSTPQQREDVVLPAEQELKRGEQKRDRGA